MTTVFDASALIALLSMEQGALIVRQTLRDNPGACYVHAVNLCEVYYHVARVRDTPTAGRTVQLLGSTGIVVREDMDAAFWQDAGRLKATYVRVSLADCYCLALARRIGGEALTADHHEFDALTPHGLCPIRFIR
jgi:PIN domain nuclease of toxin-antitoxin system